MASRRQFLRAATAAALAGPLVSAGGPPAFAAAAPESGQAGNSVPLVHDETDDSFQFETEQIEGSIKLAGAYHGVIRLVDKRTGRQVIDSRYSALNLFRLFSINQGMGQPRTMERTTSVSPHWVEVKWPPTDAHQGEITARYQVRDPGAVDVTVTVRSQGTYPGYEIFMSNYFDKVMRPHVYLKPAARGAKSGDAQRVLPMVNDVFRGTVLVFPRDPHAARRCVDGRWERSEFSAPTVQMCPVRHYGYCLAMLAAPDDQLGVVLMSHPRHCYAISTRYYAEDDADRLTTYSAFDLSLFGDDLLPGDERTVKVRLALTGLDSRYSQPVDLYRAFLSEIDTR